MVICLYLYDNDASMTPKSLLPFVFEELLLLYALHDAAICSCYKIVLCLCVVFDLVYVLLL